MNKEDWKEVDNFAKQALNLDGKDRSAFLEGLEKINPNLYSEVIGIVNTAEEISGFLEDPVLRLDLNEPIVGLENSQIGNCKILEKIGEGGMGVVYLAQQTSPIRRKVALKIIRKGMDTKQALARFASEHQALAYMDHPHVAHIYESDLTQDGRPYFTMEYVPGLPINEFCESRHLSLRQRLELFVKVCEGVQHAHQRGIIHRDLKPSNILVLDNDDTPVPKIIDFGIAKAVSGLSLTNLTLYTERGVILGTPSYMSPEQADIRAMNIDTRTDIYALGAILYELLCGVPPYDPARMRDASLSELLKIICKEEAVPPSSHFSGKGPGKPCMGMDRTTLFRELKGDLDWVTMKALEKNRKRRYSSASQLSDDIIRYLNNQTVTATPPSRVYKIRKFVKRNRSFLMAMAIGMTGLFIGVWAVANNYLAGVQEQEQRENLNRELSLSKQLIEEMLYSQEFTANARLEHIVHTVETLYHSEPLTAGTFRLDIALVATELGLNDEAERMIKSAEEDLIRNVGNNHRYIKKAMEVRAALAFNRNKWDEALHLLREVNEWQEKHSDDKVWYLKTKRKIADTLRKSERENEALPLYQEIIEAQEALDGANQSDISITLTKLANTYRDVDQMEQARACYQRALDIQIEAKEKGDDHLYTCRAYGNFFTLNRQFQQGEALFRKVLEAREERNGPKHPKTLSILHDLATNLYYQNRFPESANLCKQKITIEQEVFGENRHSVSTRELLLLCEYHMGMKPDLVSFYRDQLMANERKSGRKADKSLRYRNNLADALIKVGRYEEADYLVHEGLDLIRDEKGNIYDRLNDFSFTLGEVYLRQGKWEQAANHFDRLINHSSKGKLGGLSGCLDLPKTYMMKALAMLDPDHNLHQLNEALAITDLHYQDESCAAIEELFPKSKGDKIATGSFDTAR